MSIKNRLKIFIQSQDFDTQKAFAEATNISASTLNASLKKGKLPTTDILLKIKEKFKTINVNWLLTGEGEMLLSDKFNGVSVSGSVVSQSALGYNSRVGSLEGCKALLAEKERIISEKDHVIQHLKETNDFLKSLVKK